MQVDRLESVWVSHKHADHMLGLPGILMARSARQLPLLVRNRSSLLYMQRLTVFSVMSIFMPEEPFRKRSFTSAQELGILQSF